MKLMIMEMRVYRCLPARLPAADERFDTPYAEALEKTRIKAGRLLHHADRHLQPELTYFVAWPRLRSARKMDGVWHRSGVDRRPHKRYTHHRQHRHQLLVPTASRRLNNRPVQP